MTDPFDNRVVIHHHTPGKLRTFCGEVLVNRGGSLMSAEAVGQTYWSCPSERDIHSVAEMYQDRACQVCVDRKALYDLDESEL